MVLGEGVGGHQNQWCPNMHSCFGGLLTKAPLRIVQKDQKVPFPLFKGSVPIYIKLPFSSTKLSVSILDLPFRTLPDANSSHLK